MLQAVAVLALLGGAAAALELLRRSRAALASMTSHLRAAVAPLRELLVDARRRGRFEPAQFVTADVLGRSMELQSVVDGLGRGPLRDHCCLLLACLREAWTMSPPTLAGQEDGEEKPPTSELWVRLEADAARARTARHRHVAGTALAAVDAILEDLARAESRSAFGLRPSMPHLAVARH